MFFYVVSFLQKVLYSLNIIVMHTYECKNTQIPSTEFAFIAVIAIIS